MKGLTPQEHGALAHMAVPHALHRPTDEEEATLEDLSEQGRARLVLEEIGEELHGRWSITPAGREALKLWPAIEALFRGSAP